MEQQQQPHVLVLPYPAPGHITPLLTLSQLLCHAGIHVTFLNTEYNHRRLSQREALSARFPTLHFESIPDGLPPDHPRTIYRADEMVSSLRSVTKLLLRDLLVSLTKNNDELDDKLNDSTGRPRPPLSCVIADGIMCFALDVAEEMGIRTMAMRFISACAFWSYFCIPDLIQHGQLPFADEDMDETVTHIPGMESLLRRRDLPSFCRLPLDHPTLRYLIEETQTSRHASAFILNTFVDLEASVLSHISLRFPKLYTLGPLHALFRSRVGGNDLVSLSSFSSLLQEDRRCMTWLDSRPFGSVVYVSFGSLAKVTRDQLLEFWHGLINSGKPFLWVVRQDMLWDKQEGQQGEQVVPVELEMGSKERGLIVQWAPQEEILAHQAVGGFLTHSGWNSTMESIWYGVPMLCWAQLADQQMNSRWVSEVWKMGLDMKDTCDRSTVEKMVRALMEDEREQLSKSAERFSKLARHAVSETGSSYNNLEKLIQDLRNL